MSIRIWDPFNELRRLQNEITRVFSGSSANRAVERGHYAPLTDLYETDNEFIIKANIPGINKDDLDIEATSDYLEFTANHKEETEEFKDENCRCKERFATIYSRKIGFPTLVDPSGAKVQLESGVLTVTVPKSEKAKAVKLMPK
ncbi:MAG: Hsp20/alpha crystallin family protein [Candidatus Odinarchaeota archaeon]